MALYLLDENLDHLASLSPIPMANLDKRFTIRVSEINKDSQIDRLDTTVREPLLRISDGQIEF